MHSRNQKSTRDQQLQHRIAIAFFCLRRSHFHYLRSSTKGTVRLEGRERFVEIEARDGVVRLFGQVPTQREKSLLEEITPRVDGVVQFVGQIAIASASSRLLSADWN
jgi:hypothetical protein